MIIAAILSLVLVLSWSIGTLERLLAMELKITQTASLQQAEFMATEASLQACEQGLFSAEVGITAINAGESIEIEVSPGRVCEALVRQHITEKKSLQPKIISTWVEVTTLPFEGVPAAKSNVSLHTTVLLKHATAEIERHNWREIFIN
ncbi:hypothetical protein LZG75_02985 [Polynucleobacter sp. IMCC30063]|uniref:hypothetical protein n=1 Tax=Polynucleobacter sp. IMCC30063 TaxID=2907298 RepID=UPI001F1A13AA|nr:hypothetical protein [Polynucleobacter sp. IMCC30063]MCE7505193.1 hypothetical protein [Polynucleobacter sp. IMCC30063]